MCSTQQRKPQIGVLVHDQYQELEFWYPVLRFREEGAEVTVVGANADHEYVSRLGYPVIPDKGLGDVSPADFDAIILPGGGAADRMAGDQKMVRFVADAEARRIVIGAASQAPKVLAAAGLLGGRCVAGAPEIKGELAAAGAKYGDESVVVDGRIVTSRAPDDLPAFFQALVEALASAGK